MTLSVVTPLWQDRPAAENLDVAINADRLGYPALWIGEMATYDAFAFATAVGDRTEKIALNIGPLAVSVRTPMTMAMGVASVAALTGRPTRLAIGASSTVVVERWHGRARTRTARHLDEAAQAVRGLLGGDKVDFDGELVRTHGYHLRLDSPGTHLTIAAFGPAAVKIAAQRAERMLLNMVTPASLARFRQQVDEAAAAAGTPAPQIAVWLGCAVDPEEDSVHQILRSKVGYLTAPGYSDMFIEAGFRDLVEFARTRPHPKEVLAAMPTELTAAVGLVGSFDEVRSRIEAYRAAGADEICLAPATAGDPGGERTLRLLCPK